MKFRHLALNNVKGNWQQYVAYFMSSLFSVMLFYMYASFIFHPEVVDLSTPQAETVRRGITISLYIIVIFAVFFVLYSNSAFLKSRKKEFGLLSLYGMTNRQMKRMVFYENTLITSAAILIGMVIGTLFSKLFFMTLSELLQVENPIPFMIVPEAMLLTGLGFFLLFQFVTSLSLFRIGKSELSELFKASKKPKSPPLFSKWLVLLAIVCLGASYGLALNTDWSNIFTHFLPVVLLAVIGTYFLFTQGSVAILNRLQKTPWVYYKPTGMLNISQLIFRMKDNARMLFVVSILSAVVMTASGTFFVLYQNIEEQAVDLMPHTLSFVEQGTDQHEVIEPETIRQTLAEDGVELERDVQMTGTLVPVTLVYPHMESDVQAFMISMNDYNEQAVHQDELETLALDKDQGLFILPTHFVTHEFFEPGSTLETTVGDEDIRLQMVGQTDQPVINTLHFEDGIYLLVVHDQQHEELLASLSDKEKTVYYGYELKTWTSHRDTVERLESFVNHDSPGEVLTRNKPYEALKQMFALVLFIAIFVSILFFIAAGSIIYFKLFTELQEDQAHFKALRRIGVSDKEIGQVATTQIGTLFFVPFAVGVIHALFAYVALGNMLESQISQLGLLVSGGYLLLQIVYFLLTRRMVVKRVLE